MKLHPHSPPARTAGITLIECLVYIVVFTLLLGLATASFYLCWDNTRAVMSTTDKIEAALRAGERWRADVRGASGTIALETTGGSETLRIPAGGREIVYHFGKGEVRRELEPPSGPPLLLEAVTTSAMATESRNGVTAWRWDLEFGSTRNILRHPLWFTFEAAQTKP